MRNGITFLIKGLQNRHRFYTLLFLWLCHPIGVGALDIFANQQILTWDESLIPFPGNFSSDIHHGGGVIADYWNQLDFDFSPMAGDYVHRFVRLGCFDIPNGFPANFENFADSSVTEEPEYEGHFCTQHCSSLKIEGKINSSQAYFNFPTCMCGDAEFVDALIEVDFHQEECFDPYWKVFREYDYHTLSPNLYDVPRRLTYQQVAVLVPLHMEPREPTGFRHYLHAINTMEGKSAYHRTLKLERRTFNIVWDFGRTEMVGLSYDEDQKLELTIVHYNTSAEADSSSRLLQSDQYHFPLEDEITALLPAEAARGTKFTNGLIYADGLSVVDILYAIYYFTIPLMPVDTTAGYKIQHAIAAYDLVDRRLRGIWETNRDLVNLQVDGLTHILYGTAPNSDLNGFDFIELCIAHNLTDFEPIEYQIECDLERDVQPQHLGDAFEHSYLQSCTTDNKEDKTYLVFKENITGPSKIAEYDFKHPEEYRYWNDDVLEMDTGFTSLLQTAPKLIFALDPPQFKHAKFSPDGEQIWVTFVNDTLRGAIPIDEDGNEIPERWDNADKIDYSLCNIFFDSFTMPYLGWDSMCEWENDKYVIIYLTDESNCYLDDMIRIQKSILFAGDILDSGRRVFSQPSTDFTLLLPPDDIPYPEVYINSADKVDACTELMLDGTGTLTSGYKVHYDWSLESIEPVEDPAHRKEIDDIIEGQKLNDTTIRESAILRIPAKIMLDYYTYVYMLTVTSYWNSTYWSFENKVVYISEIPVPPLILYGPAIMEVNVGDTFSISSTAKKSSCFPESDRLQYEWGGCLIPEGAMQTDVSCPIGEWQEGSFNTDLISGSAGRTLFFQPFALTFPLGRFVKITLVATLLDNNRRPTLMNNSISMSVKCMIGPLTAAFRTGSSLQAFHGTMMVLDASPSEDLWDPRPKKERDENTASHMQFIFHCQAGFWSEELEHMGNCWTKMSLDTGDPNFAHKGTPCILKQPTVDVHFLGKRYDEPDWDALGRSSTHQRFFCTHPTHPHIAYIKPESLTPMPMGSDRRYNITLSIRKTIDAFTRTAQANLIINATSIETLEVFIKPDAKPFLVPSDKLQFEALVPPRTDLDTSVLSYSWTFFTWAPNVLWNRKEYVADKKTI